MGARTLVYTEAYNRLSVQMAEMCGELVRHADSEGARGKVYLPSLLSCPQCYKDSRLSILLEHPDNNASLLQVHTGGNLVLHAEEWQLNPGRGLYIRHFVHGAWVAYVASLFADERVPSRHFARERRHRSARLPAPEPEHYRAFLSQ